MAMSDDLNREIRDVLMAILRELQAVRLELTPEVPPVPLPPPPIVPTAPPVKAKTTKRR